MTINATEDDPRLQENGFVPPEQVVDQESHGAGGISQPTDGVLLNGGTNGTGYGSVLSPPEKKALPSPRVLAPDLLRGLLMVFQSIDHSALGLGAWRHGTAQLSENDGQVVDTWNDRSAWAARTLTHLCAPGFMFLLGMGVVYFGKSRSKLGWSKRRMARHFAVRALVLFLVNQFIGTILGRAQLLLLNIVLVALAVNYLLAGLLWLLLNYTERWLAVTLSRLPTFEDEEASQSLLQSDRTSELESTSVPKQHKVSSRATSWSWHLHNLVLVALAIITIAWNSLLSPDAGHCSQDISHSTPPLLPDGNVTHLGMWFDFWFYPVRSRLIMSGFPPLAWISFAIFGLLYGRVVTSRSWPAMSLNIGNTAAGLGFFALFVATRLLHVGNLSEDCLHMPEQHGGNQYLASFRAFFYIIKYPPSFAYLCFTMSFNHFLLAFFGALPPSIARNIPTLMTFGTSALFFYAAHLFLFLGLGQLILPWLGHSLGWENPISHEPAIGLGNGWQYWFFWVLGLAILVPLCRWYGRFKSGKGADSIWRFF